MSWTHSYNNAEGPAKASLFQYTQKTWIIRLSFSMYALSITNLEKFCAAVALACMHFFNENFLMYMIA